MFITPVYLVVDASNPAYTTRLSVKALNADSISGIIYTVSLENLVTSTGDIVSSNSFARVRITDGVHVRSPIGLNTISAFTAQNWMDGVTGQTPKEGIESVLTAIATLEGLIA